MTTHSKTREGRKWEGLYKKCTKRLFDHQKVIHNASANFGLESCMHCENLKEIGKKCPECGGENV